MTKYEVKVPNEALSSDSLKAEKCDEGGWRISVRQDKLTLYELALWYRMHLIKGAPTATAMEMARRVVELHDDIVRGLVEEFVSMYPKDSNPTKILNAALRGEILKTSVTDEPYVYPVDDPDGSRQKQEASNFYFDMLLAEGMCAPFGKLSCTPEGCPRVGQCRKQLEEDIGKTS